MSASISGGWRIAILDEADLVCTRPLQISDVVKGGTLGWLPDRRRDGLGCPLATIKLEEELVWPLPALTIAPNSPMSVLNRGAAGEIQV